MKRNLRTAFLVTSAAGLVALAVGLARRHPSTAAAAKPAPSPTGVTVAGPGPVIVAEPGPVTVAAPEELSGKVQIALLLDTSSSMSGLIDQARTQLWRIVNEMALARRADGKRPRLEIALYEYGKSTLPAEGGYIRQIVPFTVDLDLISEELFALGTNGGSEHCGQVIDQAARELAWSAAKDDLRMIFIAGNEEFTQGPVDFRAATKAAWDKGISVTTIHCGSHQDGIDGLWKQGAALGHGEYLAIDHNSKAVHIAAPQDAEIERLGLALNDTYIPYGVQGAASVARQQAQDNNAALNEGSLGQRAVSKSSVFYDNSGWDLVDASRRGNVAIDGLAEADLPEALRGLSAAARKAYVAAKAAERESIQKRIRELDAERRKYVAAELGKQGGAAASTLDVAVLEAAHASAEAQGYRFGE